MRLQQPLKPKTAAHDFLRHDVGRARVNGATGLIEPQHGVDDRAIHAVIHQMGDGTGAVMIDGKMQDDATVKQCKVVVELAEALSANDPELAASYQAATDAVMGGGSN